MLIAWLQPGRSLVNYAPKRNLHLLFTGESTYLDDHGPPAPRVITLSSFSISLNMSLVFSSLFLPSFLSCVMTSLSVKSVPWIYLVLSRLLSFFLLYFPPPLSLCDVLPCVRMPGRIRVRSVCLAGGVVCELTLNTK